ncbi:MAG TPA: DoxX family protein [Gemmatimonadales bacterium]|nr:DoxX family protein [Gemmatimonadales bacterium]
MDYLFLLGRILFGGFFLVNAFRHFTGVSAMAPYAASKGVPLPQLAILASGVLLALGGLSILLGVRPKWGILFLAMFLIPVSFAMHNYWTDRDPQTRQANEINFHKNLALLGAALMLLAIPEPWLLSLGH